MSTPANGHRTAFRTCPMCEATCGLELTLDGDRVTSIRGDKQDVLSHGFICPKGYALKELHDDPDRVRTPLLRVSARNGISSEMRASSPWKPDSSSVPPGS